jgi:hypothetical protein
VYDLLLSNPTEATVPDSPPIYCQQTLTPTTLAPFPGASLDPFAMLLHLRCQIFQPRYRHRLRDSTDLVSTLRQRLLHANTNATISFAISNARGFPFLAIQVALI